MTALLRDVTACPCHMPLAAFNTCFAFDIEATNLATWQRFQAAGHFWWACQQDNEICLLQHRRLQQLLLHLLLLVLVAVAAAKQICKYEAAALTAHNPKPTCNTYITMGRGQPAQLLWVTGINSIVHVALAVIVVVAVAVAAVLVVVISHIALHL